MQEKNAPQLNEFQRPLNTSTDRTHRHTHTQKHIHKHIETKTNKSIKNKQNLDDLKHQQFILKQFWRSGIQNPSEGSQGPSFLASSSFRGPQDFLGLWPSLSNPHLHLYKAAFSMSLYLKSSGPFSQKDNCPWIWGLH